MSSFKTVCKLQDLREGEGRTVVVGEKIVAIFQVKGDLFAIDDVCPHMGAPLSGGHVEDGIVTCPWHAWRFRLQDGAWADNLRSKLTIGCYPVRVEGDQVQIQVDQPPTTQTTEKKS